MHGLHSTTRIELRVAGRPLDGIRIERAHVFEAADRPDRFEADLAPGDPGAGAPGLDVLRPGETLRAVAHGGSPGRSVLLFDGAIERVSRRRGVGASGATVIARAHYHALRARMAGSRHWQATCGEIAEAISRGLGLIPIVERSGPILGLVTRSGDPLRFLRGLAAQAGFELAVSAGKLYLGTEFPETGKPFHADPFALVEEIEDLEQAGRDGVARIAVRGDPGLRPLAPVRVNGRRFTALRVLHRIDARGWSSEAYLVRPGRAPDPARVTGRELWGGS